MAVALRGLTPLKRILWVLLWVASASGAVAAAAAPIRIGEINPLTGRLANHGIEIHEGILYAVEEANAAGGIGGRPLELVSRDDQSLAEVAVNQAEDLILREHVVDLVGGYVDAMVGPISQLAARYRTPYVASASLQRALTEGRPNPYFFRVSSLEGVTAPLSRFVLEVVQPGKVAILHAATPGATELSQELRERFDQAKLPLAMVEKFRPGTTDFSPFLLKVREAGVDVLIVNGFLADHLILVRQLRELRVPLKAYIGPWGVAYPSFTAELGAAADGLVGMCAWDPEITLAGTEAESQRLVEGFRRRFGKVPSTTSMHGYSSARALLAALQQVAASGRQPTGEALSQALRGLDLKLPMERLQFDAAGDPLTYQQVMVQIQNGRMLAVYPRERAAAEFKPMPPLD